MEKKERELMAKLVKKIGSLEPSEINYEPETTQGGTMHKYIVVQGEFEVRLEGWIDWDDNSNKDNPSSYELIVSCNGSKDQLFDCTVDANDREAYYGKLEKDIVTLYKHVCRSVDQYKDQEAKKSKKDALKRLEETLK